MNAKEYLEEIGYGSPATSISLYACESIMESFLAHKIEEAEKANPYKSDSSSGNGIEARLIEHGYNLAINKLKDL